MVILSMRKYLKSARPAIVVIALTGCVTVGPDYRKPNLKMPETWSLSSSPKKLTDLTTWWSTFKDSVLEKLLNTMRQHLFTYFISTVPPFDFSKYNLLN
jgi:multidrug efflux system outer membrane protein